MDVVRDLKVKREEIDGRVNAIRLEIGELKQQKMRLTR
jgi:hypothetical protein